MARASVVIPAYNAAADIAACLNALSAGTERDLEIIVVDDRSTDGTADLARRPGVRVLANPGPVFGAAAARNVGAQAATGDILIFVDADVCVHADTIERALAQLDADPNLAAVTGAYDDQPLAPSDVSQWRNLLHCYTHRVAHTDTTTFWTGFGAMRRSVFNDAGGMDTSYGFMEDMELGTRLSHAGKKLRLDASLAVQHRKAWTLASLIRTDLFGRAIPYTKILLREGMANDLNVRFSQRTSVAFTGLAILLLLLTPWWGFAAAIGSLLAVAAVAALNLDYYKFLRNTRGVAFAIRTFPLHLLYFTLAGSGFTIAHIRYGAGFPLAVFFALALALQAWQGAFGADAYEADEPAHIVTGQMVREYLLRGWTTPPLEFARDYYQHYPKVGLGHWPPVFYGMQAAWTIVFPATRDSLLVMIALLTALLITGVWKLARQDYGSLAAWCAGVALLCAPSMTAAESRVMTEMPLALLMLGAMLAYGRYLDSGARRHAVAFGIWSLLCLLTKGSALVLVAVPPLAIAIAGRWTLIRRFSFWLPALIAAPASLWYLFAPGGLHQRAAIYGDPGFAAERLNWPPAVWHRQFGWVLACLILVGLLAMLAARLRRVPIDGMRATAAALVLAGSTFPLAFGVWERRHQVEEAGAFAFVAVAGLGALLHWMPGSARVKGAIAILLAAAAVRETVPRLRVQMSPGYAALAETLTTSPTNAMMVCCNAEAEGALISAVALREPTPRRYVLRGTQILGKSDWLGFNITPTVSSRQEMTRLLATSPFDWIVVDVRSEFGPGLRQLLQQTLFQIPEQWVPHGRPPLLWFTRAQPLAIGEAERTSRLRPLLPQSGL